MRIRITHNNINDRPRCGHGRTRPRPEWVSRKRKEEKRKKKKKKKEYTKERKILALERSLAQLCLEVSPIPFLRSRLCSGKEHFIPFVIPFEILTHRKSVAVAVTESQRYQTVQDSSFASKIIFRLRVPRSFRAAISPLIVQPAISVQDLRTIGETFSRRSCLFVACTRLFLHVRRAVGQRLHQPSAERTSPSHQPVIAYTTRITYVLLISERSPRKKRTRSGQALDHPRIPASQNRFVAKLDADVPRRCPISA